MVFHVLNYAAPEQPGPLLPSPAKDGPATNTFLEVRTGSIFEPDGR